MKESKTGVIWILPALCWLFIYSCSSPQSALRTPAPGDEDREFFELIKEAGNEPSPADTAWAKAAAKEYVISASTLNQQGKYAEAILEYQQALKYDSSAAILSLIASNYYQMRKYNLAREYVLKALSIQPGLISGLELLGSLDIYDMNYTEAQKVMEYLCKLDGSIENKIKLANTYEFGNNSEKAVEIYESLLIEGEEPNLLMRLAGLYKKLKLEDKYESALEKLYKYAEVKDRYAELIIEEYSSKKKYDKIGSFLDKIEKELSPGEIEDILNIAGIYYNLDSSAEVYDYIPAYLARLDNRFYLNPEINRAAGYLAVRIKDTLKANAFFGRYLNLTDSTSDSPLEIGSYYITSRWLPQSIELLEKYYQKFPEDNRFALYLSFACDESGNTRKAIDILTEALQRDKMSFDLMVQLGIMYDKAGMADSSNKIYEIALKLNPKDPLVNNNFAYSLSVQGIQLEKALAMIETALAKEPAMPSYLDTYAWIQYRMGNYKAALEYVLKALEKGGSSAEIYDHLGDIYLKLDENEKALEAWQKALTIEPGNENIKEKIENFKINYKGSD